MPDPIDKQVLTAPTCMLKAIAKDGIVGADCVDVAMLAAALGRAVGLNVAFVAEGYDNAPRSIGRWMDTLSHVYAIAETPAGWVQLDTQQAINAPSISATRGSVSPFQFHRGPLNVLSQ